MYNVFTDFHHASLLQSFILLFEKRLGGSVYRPIGMEWAEKGFWKVYDHPATQAQYLSIGSTPIDGTEPLNEVVGKDNLEPPRRGKYLCQDIDSGTYNKAITFDRFLSIPIDIVIASLPQHVEPYMRLCELHPNKPKLIYQIGNAWELPAGVPVKNVMASAKVPNIPADINFIQYHQEFDTNIFQPYTTVYGKSIYSFVNCFNVADHFKADWQLFEEVERLMPDWSLKSYGGQCRDGAAHGSKELADKMREARFIWHTKNGGDGYGHVIFNSAAVGRPLITKKSYYSGKLGEALMIDGETCINVDNLSPHHIVEKIVHYSEPDRYAQMCRNIVNNFEKNVDFAKEEIALREFLSKLT